MALTLVDISDDAASLLAGPGWNDLEAEDQARIVRDINATLQEIYARGPGFARQRDESFLVFGPRTLSGCTFTNQSKTWAAGSPAVSAEMIGCGIRVEGDAILNRIVSETKLRSAVVGTFTGQATVYGDAVPLPADFISVLGPVWVEGKEIHPFQNDTDRLREESRERGLYERCAPWKGVAVAEPRRYWIECSGEKRFLRLWPAPAQDSRVEFKGEWGPEAYTAAQVRQGAESDPETRIMPPLPGGLHEAVLLPLLRKRLAGWIHFNSREALGEIQEAAASALAVLAGLEPQREFNGEYATPGRYAA